MRNIIGVDVPKDTLDAHSPAGKIHKQFANDPRDIARPVKWGDDIGGTLIVFKATGAYHRQLEMGLGARGAPFHKINPRRARRFAQATGWLVKTDRVNAEIPARMGTVMDPRRNRRSTRSRANSMKRPVCATAPSRIRPRPEHAPRRSRCAGPAV